MIRATAKTKSGRTLLVLGIDAENVRRLTAGRPIYVDGTAHGLAVSGDVMILYGETLDDVVRELESAGVAMPPAPAVPDPATDGEAR